MHDAATTPEGAPRQAAGPDEATARLLLAAASLPADPGELALLTALYPQRRADVDALYAVPAARYADPALRFTAGATIEDWARPAAG
ncbi:hypothetical protein RVR_9469 [Actinacidiphila reveromycinica]|uniref:Uncharacterized protein n=1 Tax=Actinacidiphila reveromycinica TaxID=659352 RepID=A0A7U3VSI5_9ACTN|nr:hypothetical protein [Streptomyces sp. SN-593]BBB01860.1 hypothetical protein RVR_9469 [Streptomyces sp. SN-593]